MARIPALCFFIDPLPIVASTLVATVLASASAEMSDLHPGASQQSPAAKTLLLGKKVETICSLSLTLINLLDPIAEGSTSATS